MPINYAFKKYYKKNASSFSSLFIVYNKMFVYVFFIIIIMGICFSNNFRKTNNLVIISNNFQGIRKMLIDFIHTFHTIKKSCVIGYNVSIKKSLRQTAELLLKIQRYIKNCLKTLRDYIKRVDHAIEFCISGNEKLI